MLIGNLFTRDPAGGVPALFRGRRVSYSFNTRVAIRKACDLLGLLPGDEVLAPAYNCGSELDPLYHAGLTVTLYPVDRQARIDPAAVERLITPRTRAIYMTHYFGFLQPETTALRALCDAHGLFLIEDCALSLLSGKAPAEGRAGDVSVFCFYKFFPVIGGGALAINNDRITAEARFDAAPPAGFVGKAIVRAGLGMTLGAKRRTALIDLLKRLRGKPAATPAIGRTGRQDMPAHYYFDPRLRNARISQFAARPIRAVDVAAVIAARRENYRTYLALLPEMPGVTPLFPDLPAEASPLGMPVLVENRDALSAALVAQKISATPWWAGYNRNLDFDSSADACHLKDHVLSLPAHQYLGTAEINHIAGVLRDVITRSL